VPPPLCATLFPYTTLFRSPSSLNSLSLVIEFSRVAEMALFQVQTPVLLELALERSDHEIHPHYNDDGGRRSPRGRATSRTANVRSEEHTSELQSRSDLVCR